MSIILKGPIQLGDSLAFLLIDFVSFSQTFCPMRNLCAAVWMSKFALYFFAPEPLLFAVPIFGLVAAIGAAQQQRTHHSGAFRCQEPSKMATLVLLQKEVQMELLRLFSGNWCCRLT